MIFASIKNKAVRIAARVLTFLVAGIILLLAGISVYVNANKASILEKVHAAINKNLSGKLEVKDIDISTLLSFPYLAINLQDVQLLDSVYKKPLLSCKQISCRINFFKIGDIQHQLSKLLLKEGSIQLYTDSAGYSNTSILFKTPEEKQEPGEGFLIHKVELNDMDFTITNEQKRKDFAFHIDDLDAELEKKDSVLHIKLEQNTMINKMIFNREKGSYLEHNLLDGKMDIYFNSVAKTLSCRDSKIRINGQPYILNAAFTFGTAPSFQLEVTSAKLQYEKAIAVLTPRLRQKLSAINLTEPLSVHVVLNGLLTPGNIPLATAEWQTTNNQFGSGAVVFDECSFSGKFTNNIADSLPHTDEFSMVLLDSFTGKWHGLLLTGKNIQVKNLTDPVVTFNLSSTALLPDIDNAIGSDAVSFIEGGATIDLSYNGPLVADPAQLKNLNASLQIKDGKLLYEPTNILLEKCSGLMAIQDNQLLFKNFQFDFKRNHFVVNVEGNDMGNLSKNIQQKATLKFNIQSPYIHLDEILQVLAPSEKKVKKKRKAHFASTAGKMDTLLDNSNWEVNLSADKISKGNFYAEKLRADITLLENNWNIERVSLYHANGAITASGQLYQRNAKSSVVKADVKLQQLNIQKLFYGFNNFGQNSLTSANLRGVMNADAHINMSISNGTGAIIPRSMTGVINFSLKNGALINHKGLEEMKILFLKNRDMSNIRFAELKDRIEITPDYLYINKMEIQSTAVSMYLEGKFDMYAKNTDLLIQIPFTNFGKRDETEPVKNKGLDAKTGLSIWIGAKNDDRGEIKLTPRLSKKKFKKK